jgi:RNA polymerase sigma factor (sigma-70 family)
VEAFALLAERVGSALERYCRSIVGDEHLAKDAVQDTLVRALRARDSRSRRDGVRAWLFAIARNAALDLRSERSRHALVPLAELAGALELSEQAGLRDSLRLLLEDIAALPSRQREALCMRAFDQLSYAQIGATLGVSAAAAERSARAARISLRLTQAGRELSCAEVRDALSYPTRGRRAASLRAHLRACAACAEHARRSRRLPRTN